MALFAPRRGGRPGRAIGPVAVAAAALGALALLNRAAARRAERTHPPRGRFVAVGGVRLHHTDRGPADGPPVLLVHGNAVSGDDFETSGLTELLVRAGHRVVAFDRPGFGHSGRPRRGGPWTAAAQADLLRDAGAAVGLRRPYVVLGHSWGALVALEMAARHPADVAGLVLVSGYYLPTLRPDVALVAPVALPGLGDLLRHTVSPPLGRLLMPLLKRAMFSPARPTARFRAEYSDAMALRPSAIRAASEDGALQVPAALALRGRYGALRLPVEILAGAGDRVVFPRNARRLHAALPPGGSALRVLEGAGHMLHHGAPGAVAAAVARVSAAAAPPPRAEAGPAPPRAARDLAA